MRLDPTAFNDFLSTIGQRLLWRRAFACPCINPASGSPKPGCPNCRGKGRAWAAPVEGVAGVAGMKVQREWAQFGTWESGDTILSIPSDSPLYAMGQFDRITQLDNTEPFSVTLTRGQNDVLRGKVTEISRVFWLTPVGASVDGEIPTVSDSGVMTWATGAPPAGIQYSVTGRVNPEYFVFSELPSSRGMHSGAALPRKVVCRKFDLFGK